MRVIILITILVSFNASAFNNNLVEKINGLDFSRFLKKPCVYNRVAKTKQASATFEVREPGYRVAWKKEWSQYAVDAVLRHNPELTSPSFYSTTAKKQMVALCSGFFKSTTSKEQRASVIALFLASIAKPESAYNTNTTYWESSLSQNSVGLLQLSTTDKSKKKGCSQIRNENSLKDPKINITCGVTILSKQLSVRKQLFTSRNYYWSTLTKKQATIKGTFNRHKAKLGSFCK